MIENTSRKHIPILASQGVLVLREKVSVLSPKKGSAKNVREGRGEGDQAPIEKRSQGSAGGKDQCHGEGGAAQSSAGERKRKIEMSGNRHKNLNSVKYRNP